MDHTDTELLHDDRPRRAFAQATATELADATPAGRNRAVDAYRAGAMCAVAVGHWVGMVAVIRNGELVGGNLLDFSPGYGWFTWLAQVMPLFFFVGGFASANSLRSAQQRGTPAADWILTRLRRMVAPTATLATFWVAALAVSAALGGWSVVSMGAVAAAIPLWFLSNYTIDTALAPFTFRWFRERPLTVVAGLLGLFALGEAARFADVPLVPQANWVIGWLLFQVAGFAWAEGRLPSGGRLWTLAAGCWVVAACAVWLGPWPAVMLHHGGLVHSPTHPPSASLLLYGLAYCSTAAALAPHLTGFLERNPRAWRTTIAANSVAMSVYLWHMTAAVAVAGAAHLLGLLPEVEPGTTAWWWTKPGFIVANAAVLVPIVWKVAPVERRALISGSAHWDHGTASMLVAAGVLSLSVKAWSSPQVPLLIAGLVGTLAIWHLALAGSNRDRSRCQSRAHLTPTSQDRGQATAAESHGLG